MEAIDAASHRLSGPWCRGFLLVCLLDGHCHLLRLTVKDTMVLQLSHVEGRARDGHAYDVQCRRLPELQVALSPVRFCRALGQPLELLAGARPPKQHAARKQLAYLGLQDGDALLTDVAWPRQPKNPSAEELEGFQIASWSSAGQLVMLAPRPKATTWWGLEDGAVLLTARHRYTAFAVLPYEQRPQRRVTLAVARGFQNERLAT